jgi:hypothetical protein
MHPAGGGAEPPSGGIARLADLQVRPLGVSSRWRVWEMTVAPSSGTIGPRNGTAKHAGARVKGETSSFPLPLYIEGWPALGVS